MAYDISFLDNNTGIVTLMQGANTNLVGGHFFTMALLALAIIAIMAQWRYDLKATMISTSFGLTILAALLWAAGLLAYYVVGFIFTILFTSIFIKQMWGD